MLYVQYIVQYLHIISIVKRACMSVFYRHTGSRRFSTQLEFVILALWGIAFLGQSKISR